MDVRESLTLEDLAAPDHVGAAEAHRSALAAALCNGLNVLDLSASANQDALARLRGTSADDVDAVVILDVLAGAPDLEAVLRELERLAAADTRLLVGFTDVAGVDARQALARLEGVEWLHQYVAGGPLLVPADGGESASALIAAVGFEPGALREASAQLNSEAMQNHDSRLRALEQANEELLRANRELARGIYGKHDAAAASATAALVERVREAETRSWILEQERIAAYRALEEEKARRNAIRYRVVDLAAGAVRRTPLVYPVLTAIRRVLRWIRPRRDD